MVKDGGDGYSSWYPEKKKGSNFNTGKAFSLSESACTHYGRPKYQYVV